MRTLVLGALVLLSSCGDEDVVTVPRQPDVALTSASRPAVELRGEVDVALKNDEALVLLTFWAELAKLEPRRGPGGGAF